MAYVSQIGSLSLSRLARQTPESFAMDLEVLKGAGLTDYAAGWLTESTKAVYQVKAEQEAAEVAAWNDWANKAKAVGGMTTKGGRYPAEWLRDYSVPEPADIFRSALSLLPERTPISGLDYFVVVEGIWNSYLKGKAFEERFKEAAPYLLAWPFPNVPADQRKINGVPMIFGFCLDGSTINTEAEYNAYWGQFFLPDVGTYGNAASNVRAVILAAPTYQIFLNVIYELVIGSYVNRSASYSQSNYYALLYATNVTAYPNADKLLGLSAGINSTIYNYQRSWVNNISGGNVIVPDKIAVPFDNVTGYNYFFTPYQGAAATVLSRYYFTTALQTEIILRFRKPPPPPPPRRKRSWWQKFLSAYIPFVAPIVAIATGGLASGLVVFAGMKASEWVSKEVGGIGGLLLGGITSGAVSSIASLTNFVPAPSTLAPSYNVTNLIMANSPLPVPINNVISKGLDNVINNYIGISPETLSSLTSNTLAQGLVIGASVLAPKTTPIVLGTLALTGNYEKLIAPQNWQEFLPAAKVTALSFAPQYAQEIRVATEMAKFAPDAWDVVQVLPQHIAKIPEYILEGLQESSKILVKAPELAVKGMDYLVTHAQPLLLKGIEETGKALVKTPELAVKGATFVVEKAPGLVVEGLEESLKFAGQLDPSKAFELLSKGLQGMSQLEISPVNVAFQMNPSFQMPQGQLIVPQTEFVPVTTIIDGKKRVIDENVVVGTGASGERIIHLQATPISDNTLLLAMAGGLGILALGYLLTRK